MSHFFIIAMLDAKTPPPSIESRVSDLMAPYDENRSVEPYNKPCDCVGEQAHRDAIKQADAIEGTWDTLKDNFNFQHGAESRIINKILWAPKGTNTPAEIKEAHEAEKALQTLWENYSKKRGDKEEEIFQAHPLKNSPKKGCSSCDGTGIDTTTYNPKSQWDWYVIGGRWGGAVQGKETRKDFDSDVSNNYILVSALPSDFSCYAIITPNGEWHGKGRMGWFGVSLNEKKDWPIELKELLSKYQDHLAVGIDCHI